MKELLRDSADIPETSNPQTPGVNQQHGQQVRVARGCGTGGQYDQPGHHR